ncbi:MAG: PocR ligand-binding domain-containing protein, partial [Candidatus Omnitrophica bacterium]|nr:PocR ligand-binding domain-containing protein [Candidatus Omnitrophota bacterium]
MYSNELQLKDVVNLEEWQTVQDNFSEALDIGISTLSLDGRLLTKPSRSTRIGRKIISKSELYPAFCGQCILRKDIKNLEDMDDDTHFQCPLGMDIYAIPITAVGNKKIAYVTVGPLIINQRRSNAEYAEEAQKLGVDFDELMDALVEINVFS